MKLPETIEVPCTTRAKNFAHFTVPDVCLVVTENEKKVGEVTGCIGGGVELRFGGLTYTLNTRALWRSVRDKVRTKTPKGGSQGKGKSDYVDASFEHSAASNAREAKMVLSR